MKILVDVNLSPRWVDLLVGEGWEAVHWSSIGPGDAPDTTIMRYAAENGFVVLTEDLDYGMILAATRVDAPSVIQLRTDDTNPDVSGSFVLGAIRQYEAELAAGALLTVNTQGTASARSSTLPLAPRR